MTDRKERTMIAYRHGDLLLVAIDKPGKGRALRPVNGRLVILEGEATGHAHTVSPEHATLVTADEADGLRMWLTLTAPTRLEHQEHATIVIPAGSYEVIRQVEYEPEGLKRVMD